jgi:hypothetical protein
MNNNRFVKRLKAFKSTFSEVGLLLVPLFFASFLLLVPLLFLNQMLLMKNQAQTLFFLAFWLQMFAVLDGLFRRKIDVTKAIFQQIVIVFIAAGAYYVAQTNPDLFAKGLAYVSDNVSEAIFLTVSLIGANWVRGHSERFGAYLYRSIEKPKAEDGSAITEKDRNIIAAHEAGHAVVLGLYRELPKHVEIVMRKKPSDTGSLGHCSGLVWGHALANKAFVEWDMLFCLAGIEAERIIIGDISLGGSSDYNNWNAMAESFLAGHDELIYFQNPKNTWQEDHNAKQLSNLRQAQQALAREILLENENILLILRDELLQHNRVSGDALVAILAKVETVDGSPKSPLLKAKQS